jgi:hypothetical protein
LISTNQKVVAIVVGAASALIGLLYFQTTGFSENPFESERYVMVSIEGLKESYKVGEPIDFLVILEGYGCDAGFPHVWIEKLSSFNNQTREEIVWSRLGEMRLFPAGYSCPYAEIYQVRHIGDLQRYNNDLQERSRTSGSMPIVLDSGKYVVRVSYGDPELGRFSVIEADSKES